jgi:Uma2 family endonuclease
VGHPCASGIADSGGCDAISRSRCHGGDRSQPIEQIITHPPIAVFEVLSPEDTLQRLKRRLEDYRVMGIPEIWVIDPQDSTFYRYEDLQLQRKESFSHAEKGIVFDMNELKNLLD